MSEDAPSRRPPTLQRELLVNLGLLVVAALSLAIGTALLVDLLDPHYAALALVALVLADVGVVFLFGALARSLGFMVLRLQAEFPDGEALRRVEGGHWRRVRIEFEFESRNFLAHGHDPKGCELIVCWTHNWPSCPVEVVELSKIVER